MDPAALARPTLNDGYLDNETLTVHENGQTENSGIAVKEKTYSGYIFGCLPDEFDFLD